MPFDHERLDVYQLSLDFLALADDVVEHLPRGRGHLADQLTRAATSIVLRIMGMLVKSAKSLGEWVSRAGAGALGVRASARAMKRAIAESR